MDAEVNDRDRLAAQASLASLASDLELLGILGDPSRGPLAHLYAPPRPAAAPAGDPARARAGRQPGWNVRNVVLAHFRRLRDWAGIGVVRQKSTISPIVWREGATGGTD